MSGRPLGSRYTLDHEIGRGAVGSVWRGHRNGDGTVVAIKRLKAEVAEDVEIVRRFIQERTLLTNVVHPHVVQVLDLVVEGDTLAIVMELVEGGDLRQEIDRRGTLPPADAATYGAGVARGLAAIHEGGIVHRDVKPANILLAGGEDEVVPKVTDFGVARMTRGEITEATSATMLVGTPLYMAPEVILERVPTPASDVYSFGILLYRMLTGVTPFTGDGGAYGVMHRQTRLAPGRPGGLPDELWDVIERALAKDPGSRPSADELATELDALAGGLAGFPARTRLVHPPEGEPSSAGGESGTGQTSSSGGQASPGEDERTADDDDGTTVLRDPSGHVPAAAPPVGAPGPHRDGPAPDRGEVRDHGAAPDHEAAPDHGEGRAPDRTSRRRRRVAVLATVAAVVVALVAAGAVGLTRLLGPDEGETPNLWGMTLEEVEEELGSGVDVVTTDGLADRHAIGTVMSQTPTAGEWHEGEVEVTIAGPSERLMLEDLDPLTGEQYAEPLHQAADIGEDSFLHGTVAPAGEHEGAWGWRLDSGFDTFRATLGRRPATFGDPAEQELFDTRVVAVEITGDGEVLWSGSVSLDEPRAMTLDVEGVDDLVVRWAATSGSSAASAYLAIGDGRVLTGEGDLPERYRDG
ncbi:MAG: serine/threonine protein kinase [Actinomycetales bacterium]